MPQRYIGTFIHTPALGHLEILHDHSLLVNDDGFIAEIRPADGVASSADSTETIVLPHGTFLIPTFVDTHLHAPQFTFLGNALDKPLMLWLENTYNAELKVDGDAEFARHVYARLAQRLIEHGTSTALLFGTIKTETNLILAEEFQKAGLRGLVGKLSMNLSLFPNYVEASVAESLEAARSFITRCNALTADLPSHRRLVEPVVTPRFVPTCTDELLSGLGKIAEETGVRIQSHLAEAQDQVDRVRETTGREDIDVFDGHGLLTSRTVQAHCTFLTPDELRRMASRDAAIAHCPLSNAYFSAKQLPLREALEYGIRVGLGSDCAGGYALDMQVAMRHAVATSRIREGSRVVDRGASPVASQRDDRPVSIDWTEALFLATRGGALALGLEHCGIFRPGAAFDAQQIKLFDVDTPLGHGALDFFAPPPDRLDEASVEKWWCMGDVRNRTGMWVQGRRVSSAAS